MVAGRMISSVHSPAIGANSLSKSPSLVARAAFSWLAAENSSSSVRDKPQLRGDQFGADALWHQAIGVAPRMPSPNGLLPGRTERTHRDAAHRLHAAGDDEVVGAGDARPGRRS